MEQLWTDTVNTLRDNIEGITAIAGIATLIIGPYLVQGFFVPWSVPDFPRGKKMLRKARKDHVNKLLLMEFKDYIEKLVLNEDISRQEADNRLLILAKALPIKRKTPSPEYLKEAIRARLGTHPTPKFPDPFFIFQKKKNQVVL